VQWIVEKAPQCGAFLFARVQSSCPLMLRLRRFAPMLSTNGGG
jgi:hypothetical protein